MTNPIWESLSAEEHEAQYNPQRSVPDYQAAQRKRAPLNEAALATLRCEAEIAFGPGPLLALDLYIPDGPGPHPVHAVLHGGYWRAQDKRNFVFIAPPLVARGVMVAVLNYDLCPAVTLDGTVASALAGVEWLGKHVGSRGGDPARLTLSGHSAGAHLTAAAMAADWTARGLPADLIKGALLISGIFDPRPAMRTTVNAEIRLNDEIAARQDYEAIAPRSRCPAWVMAGGDEPWHWIDQSLRYAQHIRRHGLKPGVIVSPGFHHFDVIDQYAETGSDIARCLADIT
jgi:arylformamidase